MKIAISANNIVYGSRAVRRYVLNLIKYLPLIDKENEYIALVIGRGKTIYSLPPSPENGNLRYVWRRIPARLLNRLWKHTSLLSLECLLSYHYNQHALLISPHDIPIVATGLCPIEFNFDTASSIVSCDWSLRGEALLQAITVCDPNQYVTWSNGTIEQTYKPMLISEHRIDAKDSVSCRRQVDLMIDKMRDNTRFFCGNAPIIRIDLTAGLDSRAVLAILLSVVENTRVKANTAGEVDDIEVNVARRLANRYHFSHEYNILQTTNIESFLTYSKMLAFVTNGDTNSKRAIHPLPDFEGSPPPELPGGGSAPFKGPYYPNRGPYYPSLHAKQLLRLTAEDVIQHLEKKYPMIKSLPWASQDFPEHVRLRLARIIIQVNIAIIMAYSCPTNRCVND